MTVLSRGLVRAQELWVLAQRRTGLRARVARRSCGELLTALRAWLRTTAYKLLGKEEPIDAVRLRQNLMSFYDEFERMVDLVCAAARGGVSPGLEDEYRRLSLTMQASYPPLRSYVLAYLKVEVSDSQLGMRLCGEATDACQVLYRAANLHALLEADDGEMMGRIDRTREALYRFGDHLRSLRP